jgi:hypothetical protein
VSASQVSSVPKSLVETAIALSADAGKTFIDLIANTMGAMASDGGSRMLGFRRPRASVPRPYEVSVGRAVHC